MRARMLRRTPCSPGSQIGGRGGAGRPRATVRCSAAGGDWRGRNERRRLSRAAPVDSLGGEGERVTAEPTVASNRAGAAGAGVGVLDSSGGGGERELDLGLDPDPENGEEWRERREREQVGVSGFHITLGENSVREQVRAGGHGDSARHCRHRDDGGPVLPVKGPVVPVAKGKTENAISIWQQNNSRKKIYKNPGIVSTR